MTVKITISILSTLLVWALGVTGYFYISSEVPQQIEVSASLFDSSIEAEEELAQAEEIQLKEVIHNTQKLVVFVDVKSLGSTGSGFLYNDKGDIITNAHVVSGAQEVTVRMADATEYDGTVIGISTDTDVALIRVPELAGTKPLPVAKERIAEIGDEILALGSPLGFQNTVTTGIISGVERSFDLGPYFYNNAYQISAPIAPGNSGGPLVDVKTGEVIGINSAGIDQGSIGFTIPIPEIYQLVSGWSQSPMTSLPEASETGYEYDPIEDVLLSDIAEYLIYYFYDSLNYNDYVTAYSLLGHSWQSNLDYDSFRNGYINTRTVTIDDIHSTTTENTASVVAIITAEERENQSTVYSTYKVTYQVGYENDQVKIKSGTGERIE